MPRVVVCLVLVLAALIGPAACGDASVPSPFVAAEASVDGATDAPAADQQSDADPTLGAPCSDDEQCDDAIECTFDACDLTVMRCRHTPDHSLCIDDVHCDGSEVCDPKLGCREGEPVTCTDQSTCTIDRCIEETQSCENVPRDVDGDGDPDWACGGTDCDDTDPTVAGTFDEICGNGKDDDCDGQIDEAECITPAFDTCGKALEIAAPGQYSLGLAGLSADYGASCVGTGAGWKDAVVALIVPPGEPIDVDVVATTSVGQLALAGFEQCGVAATETACHSSLPLGTGGQISRVRLRALGPGAHALVVFGNGTSPVTLSVQFLPKSPKPDNETCGTAAPAPVGANFLVPLIDADKDLSLGCPANTGELVYAIDVAQAADVHVYAVSVDGWGKPSLTLLEAPCAGASSELACSVGDAAHAFTRVTTPQTLYLAVAATAPTLLDVLVVLSAPTSPGPSETCATAPALVPGQKQNIDLGTHTDDAKLGCLSGAVDAAFALELAEKSDVLLITRLAEGDVVSTALVRPPCAGPSDVVSCTALSSTPLRVARQAVAPGSYRVVVESQAGSNVELEALVRKAVAPTLVAFADSCAEAIEIPLVGGMFQGNSANASALYDVGCDFGGSGPGGAPEQMLKLTLPSARRVVLDMLGSGYATLLNVRKGPACPGAELEKSCAAGYGSQRSFLDLSLSAGTYFVQVDGYAGQSGPWLLNVFVLEP